MMVHFLENIFLNTMDHRPWPEMPLETISGGTNQQKNWFSRKNYPYKYLKICHFGPPGPPPWLWGNGTMVSK